MGRMGESVCQSLEYCFLMTGGFSFPYPNCKHLFYQNPEPIYLQTISSQFCLKVLTLSLAAFIAAIHCSTYSPP
jgi:hypothetical protein